MEISILKSGDVKVDGRHIGHVRKDSDDTWCGVTLAGEVVSFGQRTPRWAASHLADHDTRTRCLSEPPNDFHHLSDDYRLRLAHHGFAEDLQAGDVLLTNSGRVRGG